MSEWRRIFYGQYQSIWEVFPGWTAASKCQRKHREWKRIVSLNISHRETNGLAQIHRHLWRILSIQKRVYWHADTIPVHEGCSSGPDFPRQAHSGLAVGSYTAYTVGTVSRFVNSTWLWKVRSSDYANDERNRACTNRVSHNSFLRTEKERSF